MKKSIKKFLLGQTSSYTNQRFLFLGEEKETLSRKDSNIKANRCFFLSVNTILRFNPEFKVKNPGRFHCLDERNATNNVRNECVRDGTKTFKSYKGRENSL